MAQAILGDFVFEVTASTFKDITRSAKHRWAKVERAGRKPAMQSVGIDLEELEFDGSYHAKYVGGMNKLRDLRQLIQSREPVVFTCSWDTVNENLGRWCVESVEERRTIAYQEAIPGRVEFTVRLIEYGEEE